MRRRSGFTLVEVLVSMALILFMMSILTAAFVAATQTFSDLKASGDLAEKLRAATTVLHSDLAAYHVQTASGNTYLRDLWRPASGYNAAMPPPPPTAGFFRLFQAGMPQPLNGGVPGANQNFVDGTDNVDLLPSYLSTNNVLHYTIILSGTKRSDFLSAFINPAANPSPLLNASDAFLGPPDQRYEDTPNTTNPQVYNSQTAEVAVFLSPELDPPLTGTQVTTDGTPNGTPLYGLYRRQFLTVPAGWPGNSSVSSSNQSSYTEMSNFVPTGLSNIYFNSMQDLTMPVKRFGMDRSNLAGVAASGGGYQTIAQQFPGNNMNSSDLLLNDVVSFDVQLFVAGASDFGNLYQLTGQATPSVGITFPQNNNSQYPANGGAQVFDTWSSGPLVPPDPTNSAYNYNSWNTPSQPNSIPIYLGSDGQPISVRAVQITLRVWDFKTKKTRQVTMVQQV